MLRFEAEDEVSSDAQQQALDEARKKQKQRRARLHGLAARVKEALQLSALKHLALAEETLEQVSTDLESFHLEGAIGDELGRQLQELKYTTASELGSLYLRRNNIDAAVQTLTKAINLATTDNYMLWYKAGMAYKAAHQWHQARICFEEAMSLSSMSHTPSVRELHSCLGRLDDADAQRALQQRFPDVHFSALPEAAAVHAAPPPPPPPSSSSSSSSPSSSSSSLSPPVQVCLRCLTWPGIMEVLRDHVSQHGVDAPVRVSCIPSRTVFQQLKMSAAESEAGTNKRTSNEGQHNGGDGDGNDGRTRDGALGSAETTTSTPTTATSTQPTATAQQAALTAQRMPTSPDVFCSSDINDSQAPTATDSQVSVTLSQLTDECTQSQSQSQPRASGARVVLAGTAVASSSAALLSSSLTLSGGAPSAKRAKTTRMQEQQRGEDVHCIDDDDGGDDGDDDGDDDDAESGGGGGGGGGKGAKWPTPAKRLTRAASRRKREEEIQQQREEKRQQMRAARASARRSKRLANAATIPDDDDGDFVANPPGGAVALKRSLSRQRNLNRQQRSLVLELKMLLDDDVRAMVDGGDGSGGDGSGSGGGSSRSRSAHSTPARSRTPQGSGALVSADDGNGGDDGVALQSQAILSLFRSPKYFNDGTEWMCAVLSAMTSAAGRLEMHNTLSPTATAAINQQLQTYVRIDTSLLPALCEAVQLHTPSIADMAPNADAATQSTTTAITTQSTTTAATATTATTAVAATTTDTASSPAAAAAVSAPPAAAHVFADALLAGTEIVVDAMLLSEAKNTPKRGSSSKTSGSSKKKDKEKEKDGAETTTTSNNKDNGDNATAAAADGTAPTPVELEPTWVERVQFVNRGLIVLRTWHTLVHEHAMTAAGQQQSVVTVGDDDDSNSGDASKHMQTLPDDADEADNRADNTAASKALDWEVRLAWLNAMFARALHLHSSKEPQSQSTSQTTATTTAAATCDGGDGAATDAQHDLEEKAYLDEQHVWLRTTRDMLAHISGNQLLLPHTASFPAVRTGVVDVLLAEAEVDRMRSQAAVHFNAGEHARVCQLLFPVRDHLLHTDEERLTSLNQLQTSQRACGQYTRAFQTLADVFHLRARSPMFFRSPTKLEDWTQALCECVMQLWPRNKQQGGNNTTADNASGLHDATHAANAAVDSGDTVHTGARGFTTTCHGDDDDHNDHDHHNSDDGEPLSDILSTRGRLQAAVFRALPTRSMSSNPATTAAGVRLLAALTALQLFDPNDDSTPTLLALVHEIVYLAGKCGGKSAIINSVVWAFARRQLDDINANILEVVLMWTDCRFRVNSEMKQKHSPGDVAAPSREDDNAIARLLYRATFFGISVKQRYHEWGRNMCLTRFIAGAAVKELRRLCMLPSTSPDWRDLERVQKIMLEEEAPLPLPVIDHCISLLFAKTVDTEEDRPLELLLARVLCNPTPQFILEQAAEATVFAWNELNSPSPNVLMADFVHVALFLYLQLLRHHEDALDHVTRMHVSLLLLSCADRSIRQIYKGPVLVLSSSSAPTPASTPTVGPPAPPLMFGDRRFAALATRMVLEALPPLSIDTVTHKDSLKSLPDWTWDDWLLRAEVCFAEGDLSSALLCFAVAHKSAGELPEKPDNHIHAAECETHCRLFCRLAETVMRGQELYLAEKLAFAFDPTQPNLETETAVELRLFFEAVSSAHLQQQQPQHITERRQQLMMKIAQELFKHIRRLQHYNHNARLCLADMFLRHQLPQAAHAVLDPLLVFTPQAKLFEVWVWSVDCVNTIVQPPRKRVKVCAEITHKWLAAVALMLARDQPALEHVSTPPTTALVRLLHKLQRQKDVGDTTKQHLTASALNAFIHHVLLRDPSSETNWSDLADIVKDCTKQPPSPPVAKRLLGIVAVIDAQAHAAALPSPLVCKSMCDIILRLQDIDIPISNLMGCLDSVVTAFAASVRAALIADKEAGELGSWAEDVRSYVKGRMPVLQTSHKSVELCALMNVLKDAQKVTSKTAHASRSSSKAGSVSHEGTSAASAAGTTANTTTSTAATPNTATVTTGDETTTTANSQQQQQQQQQQEQTNQGVSEAEREQARAEMQKRLKTVIEEGLAGVDENCNS